MFQSLTEAIKEQALQGSKHDPSTSTPVGPYAHGSGGVFSQRGQDPMVFSAIIQPQGLLSVLPVVNGSDDAGEQFGDVNSEFFTTITGVTQGALETFSNQPTTKCADGARSGIMKVCTLVSQRARFRFSPNGPVNLFDAGLREDLCDPLTLRLMNTPSGSGKVFGVPTAGRSLQNALLNELTKRMFEMGISIERFLAPRVYTGSPANNNGEARDLTGLDIHINSGNKVDAYTSNVCTAMNSILMDFGYSMVTANTRDIQAYAESMLANLDWNSTHQGLGTWDGIITMRPELWEVVSAVITIRQYHESLNQAALFGSSTSLNIDAGTILNLRNSIRERKVWPLRGRNIQVVTDDAITEITPNQTTSLISGQYASDIYFIPLRVLGGIPVTYFKYYNHNNTNSTELARLAGQLNYGGPTFTTDNGMFRWYTNFRNGCLDWTVDFAPRLVMRTPQLAGRIQKVGYQPLLHFRSYDPASSYFTDGGRTTGTTQQYYAPWSTSTPVTIN